MAQPGASPSQIVRSQYANARKLRVFPNDPRDRLLIDAITHTLIRPADATENESGFNSGAGDPGGVGEDLFPRAWLARNACSHQWASQKYIHYSTRLSQL